MKVEGEEALGQFYSKGPRPVNWKLLVGLPAVILAVVGIPFAFDFFRRTHQELYVINGLERAFEVSIDGGETLTVAPWGFVKTTASEGRNVAVLRPAEGDEEQIEFEIANSFGERWGGGKTFVLNPRGAATLYYREVVYSVTPMPDFEGSPRDMIFFGEEFMTFRELDYKFRDAPLEIQMEGAFTTRLELTTISAPPLTVLDYFPESTTPARMMDFMEHHLNLDPTNGGLLDIYGLWGAFEPSCSDRAHKFLSSRLGRRPMRTAWHTAYQDLCAWLDREEESARIYATMLEKDPENSTLLYLHGRMASLGSEAVDYFERALKADPENYFAYLGRGDNLMERGGFAAARKDYLEVLRLEPSLGPLMPQLSRARLALGEYEPMIENLRKARGAEPFDLLLHMQSLEALVKSGDEAGARRLQNEYAARVRREAPEDPDDLVLSGRLTLLTYLGDAGAVLREARNLKDAEIADAWALEAHQDTGNMAQAEELVEAETADGILALEMSIGWHLAGAEVKSRTWYELALQNLAAGGAGGARLAELLGQPAPAITEILDTRLDPFQGAVALVAVACRRPEIKKPFLDRAERLNFGLDAPHHFLKRAIAELRK